MPDLPGILATMEGRMPAAGGWCDGNRGQLPGPRRGGTGKPPRFPLAKFHPPEIVFGPGALADLGHCAARLGGRRPFLVTDPGLIEAGWADEALAERFVPLAAAGGIATEGVPATEVALLLAERLRELAEDACLTTNPRAAGVGDIEAVFRAAL